MQSKTVFDRIVSDLSKQSPVDTLESTLTWFKLAVPNPSDKNRSVQLAVHVEEISEMFTALGQTEQAEAMHNFSEHIKETPFTPGEMSEFDRKELLDSLCDQIVTATGVAHMFGFDLIGAMKEVNASNYSKFIDGKPVFNEQGKIIKGPSYFKPVLDQFL